MKSLKALPLFLILGTVFSVFLFLGESGKSVPIQIFSTQGSVQVRRLGAWTIPQSGIILNASDLLRTEENASAILKFPAGVNVLVQGGSEISVAGPSFGNQNSPGSLFLHRGSILAASGSVLEPKGKLTVITSRAVLVASGAFFKADVHPERNDREWYGVLRGDFLVKLKNAQGGRSFKIPTLQKFENLLEHPKEEDIIGESRRGGGMFGAPVEDAQPENLETREWAEMASAYESFAGIRTSPEILNLSEKFRKAVYEELGFYAPGRGYLERKYSQSPKGETGLLIYYDLYPGGSFAGVNFKIQNLKASSRSFFSFDVRSVRNEGVPETVFVELKSDHKTVKTFELQNFTPAWNEIRLPLLSQGPAVDEIVILFKPDRIGPDKQGMLEFSGLSFPS